MLQGLEDGTLARREDWIDWYPPFWASRKEELLPEVISRLSRLLMFWLSTRVEQQGGPGPCAQCNSQFALWKNQIDGIEIYPNGNGFLA
jgi:hypothetical protein